MILVLGTRAPEGVQISVILYTVLSPPPLQIFIQKNTRMYYVYKEIILNYYNSSCEASKHPNAGIVGLEFKRKFDPFKPRPLTPRI